MFSRPALICLRGPNDVFATGPGAVATDGFASAGVASAKAAMPSWVAAMLMAAVPKKLRRFWLISSNILALLISVSPFSRSQLKALSLLILFTKRLGVRLAVRIEQPLATLLPRRFEFGRCDVPVRPAFLADDTQVLTKIFQSGSTKKPIAVVDLVNHKTGLEHDHM